MPKLLIILISTFIELNGLRELKFLLYFPSFLINVINTWDWLSDKHSFPNTCFKQLAKSCPKISTKHR